MHEVMETQEAEEHHGDNPLMMPVALTLSILAVLVAIATFARAPGRHGRVDSANRGE